MTTLGRLAAKFSDARFATFLVCECIVLTTAAVAYLSVGQQDNSPQ